jgi:hypothetical protein
MNQPNPQLLQRYGTSDFYLGNLEKKANTPSLTQLLGAGGTAMLLRAQGEHQERQVQEAVVMTAMLRELAARKQQGVIAGLSGKGAALSASGRAAQALNEMRQYQSMMSLLDKRASAAQEELEKEAFVGRLMASAGKGLGSMGRGLAGTAAQQAVGKGLAPGIGNSLREMGAKMQATGMRLDRHGFGAQGRLSQAMAEQGMKLPGAARAPAAGAARAAAPAVKGAPGIQGAAQAAVQSKGPGVLQGVKDALTPGWKTKAGLIAGGLGAAYLGYKGLQAVKDYMMMPSGGHHPGMLPGRLNEYGYVNPY